MALRKDHTTYYCNETTHQRLIPVEDNSPDFALIVPHTALLFSQSIRLLLSSMPSMIYLKNDLTCRFADIRVSKK